MHIYHAAFGISGHEHEAGIATVFLIRVASAICISGRSVPGLALKPGMAALSMMGEPRNQYMAALYSAAVWFWSSRPHIGPWANRSF